MKHKTIVVAIAALLGIGAAHAANEVKLLESSAAIQNYYIGSAGTGFRAVVANLGYAKQVKVRAKLSNGTWTDIPLAYAGPADNGRELWSGGVTDYGGASRFGTKVEFAVSYSVNGQTYWDNNNGANYKMANNAGYILYGVNVLQAPGYNYFNTSNNTYNGVVTVKNIAPAKQVKVVYSTDGWKTSKTAAATFRSNFWTSNYVNLTNPTPAGFEEWEFSLPVASTATQVQYAISYTVNGQTYWDNNFGKNYTAPLAR